MFIILTICIPITSKYVHSQTKTKIFNKNLQGKLVLKLTLGPFLTLSVRSGPNLQSYLFQAYISLNPSRVKQNYIQAFT